MSLYNEEWWNLVFKVNVFLTLEAVFENGGMGRLNNNGRFYFEAKQIQII